MPIKPEDSRCRKVMVESITGDVVESGGNVLDDNIMKCTNHEVLEFSGTPLI